MIHCAVSFQNRGDFYQNVYVTLLSCFLNTSSPVHMHMVTDASADPYRQCFEELCSAHGHRLTWYQAPPVPGDVLALFRDNSIIAYTAGSLFRLCLHEIIPVDKLVYVDCDIVFERDIAELYGQDPGDAFLVAAHDPERRWSLHKKSYYLRRLGIEESRYFNSGVLLMNLKKLREASAQGNVFWTYYHELAARHPRLPYPLYDQDMLNAMLSADRERLKLTDASFNYELCLFNRRCLPAAELRGKILHFAALKPWEKFFPAHLAYWSYFARTPWGGETFDRMGQRFFDRRDARMRMIMDVWRHPACFRWLWKLLGPLMK